MLLGKLQFLLLNNKAFNEKGYGGSYMHFRKLRKGIAFALMCSLVLCSACGKKGNDTETDSSSIGASDTLSEDEKNYVYRFEEISISEDKSEWSINRDTISSSSDALYMLASSYTEESSVQKVFKLSGGATEFETIDLDSDKDANYNRLTCDDEGNFYVIKEVWSKTDSDGVAEENESAEIEDAEADETVTEEGDSEESGTVAFEEGSSTTVSVDSDSYSDEDDDDMEMSSFMVKFSADGTKLWEVPLLESDSDSYIQDIDFVKDLGIVTISMGKFSLYNAENGESSELLKRECKDEDYYDGSLITGRDGVVYLLEPDENYEEQLYPFNVSTRSFEEKVAIPNDDYYGYLYAGKSYDFYVFNPDAISAFNVGDDKTTKICDFTASDSIFNYADFIVEPSEGNLYIYGDIGDGEYEFCRLDKVDPKDVVEKETITVGMVGVYDMVRKQIVRFNKTNDKYRLKIVDYSGDSEEDYFSYYDKMSLDITSGNCPDLIVVDYYMPWKSYAAKGVFEQLDSYFENDEEIANTKFLENVMNATKVDGKQYVIVPSFGVSTCVGAKDILGDEAVTLQNYEEICTQNGIDPKEGMGQFFRESGAQLYTSAGSDFIDYSTGKCNFNSEGFIALLKMMKNFPAYEDLMNSDDYDYEKYESYYRENKAILLECSFYDYDYYQATKKGYFGKDIVFNGFPGDNCGKSFIDPRMQIAMSSSCKNKDVAWQFLKSFLSDEYQSKLDYGFPVSEDAFNALEKKAQEKPYYIDEKGEKHETSSSWSIGGLEVEITELSPEETNEFATFIRSIDEVSTRDSKINDIIDEEAGAFYSGQKTAEEVADIIQSRVSIYLSENM